MAAAPRPQPYGDHWEYLRAELDLLDRLLRELVERARSRRPAGGQPASWDHGLFVADEEIDALLPARPLGWPDADREAIEARLRADGEDAVELPLPWLRRTFGLSAWELEVVLLCLAVEIHPRYERIFAYLQDDVTRRRPSLDVALDLLGDDVAARAAGRAALGASMPLRRGGLVELVDDAQSLDRPSPLLKLDERIAGLLLLTPAVPERAWLRLAMPAAGGGGERSGRLAALIGESLAATPSARLVVSLHGAPEATARGLAEEICGRLSLPLLVVDLRLLLAAGTPFEAAVREAAREAVLQPVPLVVLGADALSEQRGEADLRLRQLAGALGDFAWLAFVVSRQPLGIVDGTRSRWLSVEVPEPDVERMTVVWRSALESAGLAVSSEDASSLATRYRLGPGEVDQAVAEAGLRAGLRGGGGPVLADVEGACRDRSGLALAGLAARTSPRYAWEDIVLPAEQMRQLRELAAAARSRHRVLREWGFGAKLSRGRGLSALFSGPPGTGKTMAAEVVAGELGIDLYSVDLATVVSKYIGETEKNLSRIFDAAETTSVLLFFDEADALFGKRSEVRDAHDRYANIEIGYLLQRIETYGGLVVLATNLKGNLDEAFLRRLSFFVDFPFPGVEERRSIWRRVLPAAAPLADEVDWAALARPFPLTGGSIRGAALHAAHQAAAAGSPIGMAHLLLGVRRELDKLGKAPSPADFGHYWDEVKPR